jgi:hypothetical protein
MMAPALTGVVRKKFQDRPMAPTIGRSSFGVVVQITR